MGLRETAVLPSVPDHPAHPPTPPLPVEAEAPRLLREEAGLTQSTQRRDAGCWARRGDGSSASFWKIFSTVLFCYSCHSKISRVRGLNNRNRGWKSEIKVLAELLSPKTSLPGLQTAVFSQLSSYCLPSVCLCPNLLFL